MEGPTQTAVWGGADEWKPRPAVARFLRVTIAVVPLLVSLGASYWLAQELPPQRIGLPVWIWWSLVALIAFAIVAATDRVARRFLPLVALLKLSLIFPDEAPSRMRSALRRGTTAQLDREVAHVRETGDLSERTSQSEYLISLMRSLAEHDPRTRGHSERVRAYANLIGEEMGLADHDRELLHWAALLHDVGKLDVPADVLNTEQLPTEEEWAILQRHPEASMPYMTPLLPWLGQWAHAAEEHHLRWDGLGYPTSKGGTEISMAGRIVAVADAFDVMTSARSYKEAMPAADARAEIAKCAGTQFDPAVTRAFLNVGLGRLRLTVGPLSWLGHTLGLEGVSVGTIAGPVATVVAAGARTVATAAIVTAGVAVGSGDARSSEPPAAVAFEAVTTPTPDAMTSGSVSPAMSPSTTSPSTTSTSTTSTLDSAGLPAFAGETVVDYTAPASSATSSSSAPATTIPVPTTTASPATTSTSTITSTSTTSTTTTSPTTTTTTTSTTTTTQAPENLPPQVDKPPFQEVPAGTDWSYQIVASDPEGQALSYSASDLPPGLAIHPASGAISGFIPADQAGIDYHVRVDVSDGVNTKFVKFWIDLS